MAHKIDFTNGTYGVNTTPRECKTIVSKLTKLGFTCSTVHGDTDVNSIWIDPSEKIYSCYSLRFPYLICNTLVTPKQMNAYLNKLLKEGSYNQPK